MEENLTYGEFMKKYEGEMDVLDVYDKNGEEIPEDKEIPDDAVVLGFSRRSGFFDVQVNL